MRHVKGTGIYEAGLLFGSEASATRAAAELDELGYGAIWIPDVGGDLVGRMAALLKATRQATVASGVLNMWLQPAERIAGFHDSLDLETRERVLFGIGASHAPYVDSQREEGTYRRPLTAMNAYLDELDTTAPLPVERRILAALGPKMLDTARERSVGAHTYLVTPAHTATAREALGSGSLLVPEQGVVLETDPSRARAIARKNIDLYFDLPNYVNNWRREGFTEEDVARPGSDRLIDALVAWGDEQAIADRIAEHRAAGADHVCLQVMIDRDDMDTFPLEHWRRLAPAVN